MGLVGIIVSGVRLLLPLVVDVDGLDDESLHHLEVLVLESAVQDRDDERVLAVNAFGPWTRLSASSEILISSLLNRLKKLTLYYLIGLLKLNMLKCIYKVKWVNTIVVH